ncbi:lytic transglycosylase domain-containing protein [Pseudomonas sp. D1-1]|uniref:lytic transglycosylase domain-containing protein n=1 Tax=Pseudomonas sp. D1-1 TaxID=1040793 RepID=UPI003DA85D8A
MFATRPERPINFGQPSQVADQPIPAQKKSEAEQADLMMQLMEVIMQAIMQWLHSSMNRQEGSDGGGASQPGPQPHNTLMAQPSGGGGGAPGGPINNAQAGGVAGSPALRGQDGLHLPAQLEPYRQDIVDASNATGVPGNVIAAQIWAESRGNLNSSSTNVNGKTDAGLMQVNADTFAQLKRENPALLGNADVNNPRDNIMAGALYLRDQTQAFGGDLGAGLRAYNSGPDKVNRNDLADTGGVGDPGYPANVLKFAEIIASGKGQLPG